MDDIVKGLVCATVGVAVGIVIKSTDNLVMRLAVVAAALLIVILFSLIFRMEKKEKAAPKSNVMISSSNNSSSRVSSAKPAGAVDARISRPETKPVEENRNRTVKELVLINEEGDVLFTWGIQGKTSLIIGKGTPKEPVDIDLSMSAMGQMISKQHAVLNYTNDGWCIDDIDSKNGTRVRKLSQNAIMDVKLVGSVQVGVGDIIYIASTMLQLR